MKLKYSLSHYFQRPIRAQSQFNIYSTKSYILHSYTTKQIWTKRNLTIKTKTRELAEFYLENNHQSKLAMKSGQRAWGAPSHQLYDKASTETKTSLIPSNRPGIFDRLRNARESPAAMHFGHSTARRK